MTDLHFPARRYKVYGAWLGEKLGRVKPNGRPLRRSGLALPIELEAMRMGVTGKALLWRSLLAAVLLVTVGDGTSFPTAAHLASYAGLAPATKSSGTSIHGEHAPRGGNRQLKRAMFLSAFAALHDPASRTHYDGCRARGEDPHAGPSPLARQRISVLFAMLRDGTFYEPRLPQATAA
jgi:hypothetical protein